MLLSAAKLPGVEDIQSCPMFLLLAGWPILAKPFKHYGAAPPLSLGLLSDRVRTAHHASGGCPVLAC
jgi:hypothetical protein